jgi:hypothetical protein
VTFTPSSGAADSLSITCRDAAAGGQARAAPTTAREHASKKA